MDGEIKKVRIHYRLAQLAGGEEGQETLQAQLTTLMGSPLGQDTRERLMPIAEEDQHRGCLNFCKAEATFFIADIMHLDGRTSLPRWIHPTEPKPFAEIVPRAVAKGEASLGEPVYVLVAGNHVAVIERMGFRTSHLARYLNALLAKGGQLALGTEWKLVPKIEVTGEAWKSGGVKKIVVTPHAAFMGDAPSQAPEAKGRRRARAAVSALEDLVFRGQKVLDALVTLGADQTKLEKLRQAMSTDLVIKAKLELSVASVRRKTTAEVSPDAVQMALADLTRDGDVLIVSENGRSDGKLVQLVHSAEVLEVGGLIDWARATQALSSALSAWAAKGAIEIG